MKKNSYYVDEPSNYQNYILKYKKIEQVKLMGNLLKAGDFNKLFEIAGLLNQSDPDQIYLKKSEIIFKESLLSSPMQIDDLYALAISQILQREAKDALETIKKISEIDKYNPQLYLARSIVETYLLDFKNARLSIEKAKFLNKDKKNEDTINTSYSILKLFSFKFLEGLNELI